MASQIPSLKIGGGQPRPLGCSEPRAGDPVNFALRAPKSKSACLVLWPPASESHKMCIHLDPAKNRSEDTWHLDIVPPFPAAGTRYAWLLDPALKKKNGKLEVDESIPHKYIIDPCARALDSPHAGAWNRRGKERYSPKAVVPDYRVVQNFDWQGVASPGHELKDLIIYEAHVRGFTKNPDSGVTNPEEQAGTYQAFLEKIPHLRDLGVNCVELLPVFEFDETACPRKNPQTGEQLSNYWGYSTVGFCVPMQRFNAYERFGGAIVGFKTLVRELHREGIEVILDVVFNHTAEGTWGEKNWHSLAAIAKSNYYIMSKGKDTNYTGCGNTVNANDPVCTEWICDCLRYWVADMHVDGFRFDLASALTRGSDGKVQKEPLLMKKMAEDEVLKNTKLIAEPWDCSWPDGYLVGNFPSCGPPRWAEWNGMFRDTARQFIKGDDCMKGAMATRLCGSSDLFKHNGRGPCHSINFITAHDGFTLRDLVSYNGKHNECNGENSGDDHNNSWNCGAEGSTGDGAVNALRERQMRNFLVALLLSIGTPMLTFGDEYGRSQHGCNNGWCQDARSWFSWSDCARQESKLLRFCRLLIRFRKQHKHIFCKSGFLSGKDIWWRTDWDDTYNFLNYVLHDNSSGKGYIGFLFAFNAGHEHRDCHLPTGKTWYRIIDSSLPSPKDFCEDESSATKISGPTYGLCPYSCIVLKTFVDCADAVNYAKSDSRFETQQDLEEATARLARIANRSMSKELIASNDIGKDQVWVTQMTKRRSLMSGIFIELAGQLGGEPSLVVERPPKEIPPAVDRAPESNEKLSFTPAERVADSVKLRFLVTYAGTRPGETVFVVGDVPQLGSWNPDKGLACRTTADSFPDWTSDEIVVDPKHKAEFKFVVRGNGGVRWEDLTGNHQLNVSEACDKPIVTVSSKWGTREVLLIV